MTISNVKILCQIKRSTQNRQFYFAFLALQKHKNQIVHSNKMTIHLSGLSVIITSPSGVLKTHTTICGMSTDVFSCVTICGPIHLDILTYFLILQMKINVIFHQDGVHPTTTGIWSSFSMKPSFHNDELNVACPFNDHPGLRIWSQWFLLWCFDRKGLNIIHAMDSARIFKTKSVADNDNLNKVWQEVESCWDVCVCVCVSDYCWKVHQTHVNRHKNPRTFTVMKQLPNPNLLLAFVYTQSISKVLFSITMHHVLYK
jgi:hypothetical protein